MMTRDSFVMRIFSLLVLLTAGTMLTYFLFYITIALETGFNTEQINVITQNLTTSPKYIRILQLLQGCCIFILPSILYCKIFHISITGTLSLNKPRGRDLLMSALSIIFIIPFLNVLVEWNEQITMPAFLSEVEQWMRTKEDQAAKVTELLLSGTKMSDLIQNLIVVAAMAAIGEELFFRGLLTSALHGNRPHTKTPHLLIWAVAFLFSAVHLQFYGFIPRLLLGAWFGYLLWWSGSIFVPMLAHFTNNAISTLAIFSTNKGLIKTDIDSVGMDQTWWMCIPSILFFMIVVGYFTKREKDASD